MSRAKSAPRSRPAARCLAQRATTRSRLSCSRGYSGATPNGVVSGPTDKGDAYIIARVTGIFHPPLPTNSRGYRNGLAELASQVGQDLSAGLAENEKSKEKVVINQKLLDQALGGGGEGP